MAKEATAKVNKPEGSLKTIEVNAIQNNPYRPNEVFVWNEDKIMGLKESMLSEGFWSSLEVTENKWGEVFIAGGGHHRIETLRRLIKEGIAEKVRGLFKNDGGDWCVKVVSKKYTKEEMLKMFMLENADAWGKDDQQNVCMMVLQVKSYLDEILKNSDDLEDFIEKVKSPYPLKMDARAYTRTKNAGAGASLLVQFLGENTWSRPAVDMAIKVLYEDGEISEHYKELAEKLPNVTTAYRFKKLMTFTDEDGDKVKVSEADQKAALKKVENNQLSRNDLEQAEKIKTENNLSPLEAIDKIIEQKKDEKAAAKGEKKSASAPSKTTMSAPEEALDKMKSCRIGLMVLSQSGESWSKAQFEQAKDLFKDIAECLKKLDPTAGKTPKNKNKKK